tara:strand:+ start:1738 stop:2205 length:468 start_codon:yes stop_codon:yes gene_type:complete
MSQPSPKQADEPNAWMWDKHFDALVRYKDGPGGGNPNRPRGHVLSSHLPAAFLLVSSSFYLVMSRPTYSAGVLIEESNLVELKGKTLEYGEAFFFGNSVTRHYAFSFCHGDHEHRFDLIRLNSVHDITLLTHGTPINQLLLNALLMPRLYDAPRP